MEIRPVRAEVLRADRHDATQFLRTRLRIYWINLSYQQLIQVEFTVARYQIVS
jgi:hypothetical protein